MKVENNGNSGGRKRRPGAQRKGTEKADYEEEWANEID